MEIIEYKDVKAGDRIEIKRCGHWKVESVRLSPSGKSVYIKYTELNGEHRHKATAKVYKS